MKILRTVTLALIASNIAYLALTTGCADREPPPPPPGVAVVGFAPDYCFWDGYEYIAWDPYRYYYWAPTRVWVVCDPVRIQRVNVWVRSHPDWHTQVPTKPTRTETTQQPQPPPKPLPTTSKHDRTHNHDRD